jgi:hypothetical protein
MESAGAVRVEAPPQRYRVVEQDRRLRVIDTWAKGAPQATAAAEAARGRPGLRRLDFGGTAELTTQHWYDLNGPRTLTLDPGAAALVSRARLAAIGLAVAYVVLAIAWPGALVLLALVFQPKLWKGARERVTTWLDRFAPA